MDFLNYHHLRYFWVVAREGSMRAAADLLHVSKPTISAQIQALEASLDEKLFRRHGRKLSLTETGRQVLSYADEIFALGQELVSQVKQRPTARPLRIQIGIVDSLPKLVSYQVIKPIFHLPEPVQAVCRENNLTELLVQLTTYRLDVVLADEPAPGSHKAFNHFLGDCGVTFCAVPALARQLARQFPRSLHNAPVLLPAAGTAFRRALEAWFHAQGIRPRLMAELEDAALMNAAALDGLGFFPIPHLAAADALARFSFQVVGRAEDCREQFYAITAERKLRHPGVVAITSRARAALQTDVVARTA